MTLRAQGVVSETDSLENILQTNPPEGAGLLRIYSELSAHYSRSFNPEKNMEYTRKGILLARQSGNRYEVCFLYNNLGMAYDDLSKYDSALIQYNVALSLIEEMESKKQESVRNIHFLKGTTFANIGNLYNVQGLSDLAVEHYLKSIAMFEETDARDRLSKVFRNLSLVYVNMKNYGQAEYYLTKNMEICTLLHDSVGMASTLTRLGHIYVNQFKYPQALQCAEDADKIYARYAEKRDLRIYNLRVLCAIWNNGFSNEEKAEAYALEALDEAKKLSLPLEVSRSFQLLGALHLEHARYPQAKQMAMEALKTDSNNLSNNILLYECLTIAHAGLGNMTEAQEYFNRYKEATTAYSNENFQSSLAEMEVKYETEKKETQIAALKAEKRLMMWLSVAGSAVLLLVLAAFFLLWRWTVQKKRLAESQRELAEQQVKQLEQEKQLVATQAVLDGEVQERARLARDLHDSLGSILAAVKYNLINIKQISVLSEKDAECYNKAVNLLDDSMREMRRVAHHLMPDALSRFGLKPAIGDFCDTLPAVQFAWYGDESRLDPKLEEMVYRIVHELIGNALKHSGAAHIFVQIVQETGRIALVVQDDGGGFDPETVAAGMGLSNIRTRVASSGGIIHIDSKAGVGTEINIEFQFQLKVEN